MNKTQRYIFLIVVFSLFLSDFLRISRAEQTFQKSHQEIVDKVVSNIVNDCKNKQTKFDDESAAVAAIKLFGWSAMPSLIKARGNINYCECWKYNNILSGSIHRSDRNIRSVNYNKDISFLTSHFSDPSKFKVDLDLSVTNNFAELLKAVEKISYRNNKYTDDSINQYLEFIYKKTLSGKLTKKEKENFIHTIHPLSLSCLPKSSYWLFKFDINPYAIIMGDTRYDSHNRENLRYSSVFALAKNYKNILSGLIYLSFAEKQYDFVSGYIDVALQPAADLDAEYIRNILKTQTGYSLNSVILSLGKSGNRGYRKFIIPFLKKSELKTQHAAAVSLCYLGDDRSINTVKDILENSESDFKDQAIASLGKLGTTQACDLLLEELKKAKEYYPTNIIKAMADTCNNEYLISKLLLFQKKELKRKDYIHDAILYLTDKDN